MYYHINKQTITTKYNLGDKVFLVVKNKPKSTRTECPKCHNKGLLHCKEHNVNFKCPTCFGRGYTSKTNVSKFVVSQPKMISSVITSTNISGTTVRYNIGDDTNYILEEHFYSTGKEAQLKCDELNINIL